MARMSENFNLRQCFLDREQVRTQSEMIKKMSPPLAQVYFKSMNYKIKVLAGLEPPLKGGGKDWYVPPKELLKGRAVMHPVKNEHLQKLTSAGIGYIGEQLVEKHHKEMGEEEKRVLLENDNNWKQEIEISLSQAKDNAAEIASKANTAAIQQAFKEFSCLYTTSINNIEAVLFDGAVKEIKAMQDETLQKMNDHCAELLDKQAKMLYARYTKNLNTEKEKLKSNFIKTVEETNTAMVNQIHDLNLEKHIVIEKLRQLLESMNLACQVYVALKEREECQKEMEQSRHEQKKTVKSLDETIAMKDFEIRLAQEKEKKRQEFNNVWKKKMCEVVKKFQLFATYCLKTLPEHADFFINMEKLMMLQLSQAIEDPSVPSIIVPDPQEGFRTPIPKPHPFYLCCDKGNKPNVNQDLCPKHCTSSASQLPVVIVNKRCIYAACDNFEKFTENITEFIHGRRGDEIDFEDNHNYNLDFQHKMTSSQQLLELKLESSLMQVLQKELPNVKKVPTECCICKIPYCFCSPTHVSTMSPDVQVKSPQTKTSVQMIPSGTKIETRSVELMHEREPKLKSYMQFVTPTKCKCAKTAKKHLHEHLPAYMRNMSTFEETDIPNYEKCSVVDLKQLVKQAQGKRTPLPPVQIESRTHDIGTQYSDQDFEELCTCFSDDEVKRIFNTLRSNKMEAFNLIGGDFSSGHVNRRPSQFAMESAKFLRNLICDSQMEEIFRSADCNKK